MKPEQKHIYYVIGETWNAARQSPHLERLRQHGVEVLLLHDRVDEWMTSYLGEYQGKSFKDVSRGDLELADLADKPDEDKSGADSAEVLALCGRLREALSGRVEAVRGTQRLAESAACLVRGDQEVGVQMRKLMEAAGQHVPVQRPTLEVNPTHPLVMKLQSLPEGKDFSDWAALLLDEATLAEGGQLDEPGEFVKRLNRLLLPSASL